MTTSVRRIFAVLAAFGAIAGASAYLASFRGATMDSVFPLGLHLYMIGTIVLIVIAERNSHVERRMWFRDATLAWPRWATLSYKFLALLWIVHLILFLIQTKGGAPEIKDGVYVLSNHGRIIRELAESEYRSLKGAELRLFAVFWATGLSAMAFYWWFPRAVTKQQPDS